VRKIVLEIVIEVGMQKIVIEICMEQSRLFQCNRFHWAEHRQNPNRFFSGSGWSLWIFMPRVCAVHDVITSTSSLLRQS